jgi:hypothetical protein
MVLCQVLYCKALVSCLKGFSDSKVAKWDPLSIDLKKTIPAVPA